MTVDKEHRKVDRVLSYNLKIILVVENRQEWIVHCLGFSLTLVLVILIAVDAWR